jgi:hypothetical protein
MPTRKEILLWLPLVIKRELYKCGQNYLRVNDVGNWPSSARRFCLARTEGNNNITLIY